MNTQSAALRLLALAALCLSVTGAAAENVLGRFELLAAGFANGIQPVADIYGLVVENTFDQDVTAIQLDLTPADLGVSTFVVDSGGFLNPNDLTFGPGLLPVVRGPTIVDSFVVLPGTLAPLSARAVFEPTEIAVAYTTRGAQTLVASGSRETILHLSVPAGESPLSLGRIGRVAYSDLVTDGDIVSVPEPATALLACLALVGSAIRRKV